MRVNQTREVLAKINPLIGSDQGSSTVNEVLGLLSFLFMDRPLGVGLALSNSDCIGLSAILETCQAAVEQIEGVSK